jgi:hypothetical protein
MALVCEYGVARLSVPGESDIRLPEETSFRCSLESTEAGLHCAPAALSSACRY